MTFNELKKYFRFMGIFPRDSSRRELVLCILINWIYFGMFVVNLMTMIWYLAFDAESFRDLTKCFFYMCCNMFPISWYSVYLWQRTEYIDLFNDLDALIGRRSRMSSVSKTIYERMNDKIEKMTKLAHLAVLKIEAPFIVTTPMLISYWQYFTSGHSKEAFLQYHPASYPFDWQTCIGYGVSASFQALVAICAIMLFVYTLVSTIGLCSFVLKFLLDLEINIHDLNATILPMQKSRFDEYNPMEIIRKTIEIIKFHSEARNFANRFSDINNGIIFVYFVFSVVSFGIVFLQVNMAFKSGDLFDLIQVFLFASTVISWLYCFCHFGNNVTQRFEEISDELYNMAWYEMSMKMRKSWPFIIQIGQQRVFIRGVAKAHCNREIFMQILNKTYSFSIMLSNLDF